MCAFFFQYHMCECGSASRLPFMWRVKEASVVIVAFAFSPQDLALAVACIM